MLILHLLHLFLLNQVSSAVQLPYNETNPAFPSESPLSWTAEAYLYESETAINICSAYLQIAKVINNRLKLIGKHDSKTLHQFQTLGAESFRMNALLFTEFKIENGDKGISDEYYEERRGNLSSQVKSNLELINLYSKEIFDNITLLNPEQLYNVPVEAVKHLTVLGEMLWLDYTYMMRKSKEELENDILDTEDSFEALKFHVKRIAGMVERLKSSIVSESHIDDWKYEIQTSEEILIEAQKRLAQIWSEIHREDQADFDKSVNQMRRNRDKQMLSIRLGQWNFGHMLVKELYQDIHSLKERKVYEFLRERASKMDVLVPESSTDTLYRALALSINFAEEEYDLLKLLLEKGKQFVDLSLIPAQLPPIFQEMIASLQTTNAQDWSDLMNIACISRTIGRDIVLLHSDTGKTFVIKSKEIHEKFPYAFIRLSAGNYQALRPVFTADPMGF